MSTFTYRPEVAMLSHAFNEGVLVCTVQEDPRIQRRAELANLILDLARVHQPAPVVVVIDDAAATPATASAILRARSQCTELGVVLSVASHSAPLRRLLQDGEDPTLTRLVIHTRIDTAIDAATQTL
ncbi:hypothetical protein [Streptomyces sp. 2131.1]|uniref:hypothetical protein n=1 Tax=Streptomyces sp. 2131.1 TaxID=1855346 RepID=UPI00210CBAFA|nr:hypothetical protein [Streptomyces sp. 2131.1]